MFQYRYLNYNSFNYRNEFFGINHNTNDSFNSKYVIKPSIENKTIKSFIDKGYELDEVFGEINNFMFVFSKEKDDTKEILVTNYKGKILLDKKLEINGDIDIVISCNKNTFDVFSENSHNFEYYGLLKGNSYNENKPYSKFFYLGNKAMLTKEDFENIIKAFEVKDRLFD